MKISHVVVCSSQYKIPYNDTQDETQTESQNKTQDRVIYRVINKLWFILEDDIYENISNSTNTLELK